MKYIETRMDSLFAHLLGTKFVQDKLAGVLMSIFVNVLQTHFATGLCILFSVNPYIDFLVGIAIPVLISTNIHLLYAPVQRYNSEFGALTRFIIDNYSFENYRRWKRIIILLCCVYLCLVLWRVTITNGLLIQYIIQYAVTSVIIDAIDTGGISGMYNNWRYAPTIRRGVEPVNLISSYMSKRPCLPESLVIDQTQVIMSKND